MKLKLSKVERFFIRNSKRFVIEADQVHGSSSASNSEKGFDAIKTIIDQESQTPRNGSKKTVADKLAYKTLSRINPTDKLREKRQNEIVIERISSDGGERKSDADDIGSQKQNFMDSSFNEREDETLKYPSKKVSADQNNKKPSFFY